MNRIDELVTELCPDGVAFRSLGDLVDYEQPTKYLVESVAYDSSFKIPVLTAGQTFILGYTDETDGVYPASVDEPVVIFDDFTTAFKWVDFEFKAKSSAMKMLTLKPGAPATLRYVYHAMRCLKFVPQSHARHWISTYSMLRIAVPPIEVQREVVELLDRFQGLENNLESALDREISLRRRQFLRHRDSVLSFKGEVTWSSLPALAINLDAKRKPVTKAARVAGDIPYYGASGIVDYVSDHLFDGDYLLISEDGANLLARSSPIAFSISGKAWVNNHAHVLEFESDFQRRFVEIYLNSTDLSAFVTGGAQAKLSQANLNRIPIPVLQMAEHERIVSLLDDFKASTDQLLASLVSERTARRKQYELYRGNLLTFEEAVA